MLMKLHFNEFLSRKQSQALAEGQTQLQAADTLLQSVNEQLTDRRQHCQQLHEQLRDAEAILRKEVSLTMTMSSFRTLAAIQKAK